MVQITEIVLDRVRIRRLEWSYLSIYFQVEEANWHGFTLLWSIRWMTEKETRLKSRNSEQMETFTSEALKYNCTFKHMVCGNMFMMVYK